jgi:nucleoside diphosphate kinase
MRTQAHVPAQPHALVRDPDYIAGVAALRDAVGIAADRVASRTGLVLFTPACVVAARVGEGLACLEAAGFTVAFARRVALTELQVRRIWWLQSAGFAPDRWSVAVRLFCAGPAVVALVTARAGAGNASAAERLRALKGPSDPDALAPHHMRKRLGALNRLNNLVHSADSAEAVVREAWLMLPPSALRAGWSAARGGRRMDDLERFLEANAGPTRRDSVSLAHVGVRLLWRAFDLACPSARAGAPGALREALVARLAWTRREPADDGAEALRRWRARYGAGPTAPAFREWAGDGAVARAYCGVEDVLAGRPVALAALEHDLGDSGLAVDRWERLVLASEVISQQIRESEAAAAGRHADDRGTAP